ncbi:MAG: pyrroloquinoline quinone biosynthesis protein PqqD [Gammaproteobacteria bacterium RIFCSPLOWO2_02_FULL_57_10]|nr:MAG: pyrroloquinoline quinone biosynthesis protein PqqD [Gammaproteobacteria bacterium RIFCSPLOWO2_02_FULL_57_10]
MTLPTDKALVLERQFRFQWEPAQNTHVLLYPEGLIKLPGSAGEIMKRIDGKASAEDIVRSLEQAFPGADLQQDVIDFLEVAHDKGWIRVA